MKKIFYKKIILTSAIFFSLPFLTNAAAIGDGVFIYDQTTPTTNVQSRLYTEATTTVGAASSPFAGSGTSKHVYSKSNPIKNEMLTGIQDSAGLLTIYKSTDYGVSWVSQWTATVGDGNLKRFEIAYEQTTGDAIVIYSANVATTNEIKYQTWNGTSWSGALNLDAVRTTGTIYGIRAAERSGSNEIGIVWVDTNLDISANVWTGTAWYGEPAAALSTSISRSGGATPSTVPTRRGYDIAFESLTGRLMVAWGDDSGSTTQIDPKYVIKAAGGAWGTAASITNLTEDGEMIDIAPSPISNKIAFSTCSVDTGADCNSIVWSGTAWGSVVSDTTSAAAIVGESSNNVEWLVDGTNEVAVITYSDAAGGAIDWYTSVNGATPTSQTDNSTAPAIAGLERAGFSKVNPSDSREGIFIFEDANADIFVKRAYLTGTTVAWSNPTGLSTAIETNTSVTGFNPVGFAFVKYVPITAPTVTTQAVTGIGYYTATGNGNVTGDGNGTITERGVVWSTSTDPTTSNSKAIATGTTGAYTADIVGLNGNTLYYVRAYAINSAGTSYGSNVTFTTLNPGSAPTITLNTLDATDFGADTTPTLEMTASDADGDDVQYNIQISTDPAIGSVLYDRTSERKIWVAAGNANNTMAYSYDGINWTGLGTTVFATAGRGVAWNGKMFVAAGQGTNNMAYSYDGINWTGVTGTSLFTTYGWGVAWNGSIWVATGQGTNSLAYSYNGIDWTAVTNSTSIFSSYGFSAAWNGSMWVATGSGTAFSLATSTDGINWTGVPNSKTLFSTAGLGIATNGTMWVAGGYPNNSIAYSSNGTNWTGLGTTVFASAGYGVAWNGSMWVAVGQGNDTIAYSSNGTSWTPITAHTIYSSGGYGRSIAWNGTMWESGGVDTLNTLAYSSNGTSWTGKGTTLFNAFAVGIASNSPVSMIPSYTVGVGGEDFLNTVTPSNLVPFNQAQKVSYTVPVGSELTPGTYYWRARAKDQTGTNTYSSWSSIRSFVIGTSGTLPVSGALTSSVLDTTSSTNSVGYNSIMWKGALGGTGLNEGKVRFQLATSASTTGPWNYYGGATCGSLDWFETTGPNNPVELKGASCISNWNNKRYYRYKIQICSDNCVMAGANTPTINNVVVNWSH